jgi:3-phenylpropionate/trans-cinnamate dioxygenase ferredoxin subunit
MTRHIVATVGEIAPGRTKLVTVSGRDIAIINAGGDYFAFFNRCPHAGGSLCHGTIVRPAEVTQPGEYKLAAERLMLRCPWHGWQFDLRTGEAWCDPATLKARSYPAIVESGAQLAKGRYVAETFQISVDQDYVLIEI